MNRSMVRLALVLGVVLLAACSDDPTGIGGVDRVDVGPADQVLVVGDSMVLTAVPLTDDGDVVVTPVLWRSVNPTVATLRASSASAVLIARAAGVARVEAEAGGRMGFVTVTIAARPEVASVTVLPATMVLEVGQETAVRAVARAGNGEVIDGRAVTWTMADGAAATVTPQAAAGWATLVAAAEGSAVVRATIDGVAGEAEVQVVPAGPPPPHVASVQISPSDFSLPVNHEVPLQAIAKDVFGDVVSGLPVTWQSSAPGVATVTPIGVSSFASVLSVAPGTATIRATIGGATGEVSVAVTADVPPPDEILYLLFDPQRRGVWMNQVLSFSQHLVAVGRSGPIADPAVTWEVEDETIATVDEHGSVTGVSAGTTQVHAVSGTVQGTATITVFAQPGDVASYDLTYDWWDGQWHVPPVVGQERWTDEFGVEHDVPLWPARGLLDISSDGIYERVLIYEGYAWVNGVARKVIDRMVVDRGMATIIVGGETGYRMISSTTPGYEYVVHGAYNAGHVTMRAVVGTAPQHEYLFRLQQ